MAVRAKTKKRLFILLGVSVAVVAIGAGFVTLRLQQIQAGELAEKQRGIEHFEQGDYYDAMHALGSYIRSNPDDIEASYLYAQARLENPEPGGQHLFEAMGILRRVAQQDPGHATAAHELLEIYETVGYNTEALDLARQLLDAEPDNADVFRTKATTLMRLQMFDRIEAMAAAALEQDENEQYVRPDDIVAEGLRARAHAMVSQERHLEALEASRSYNDMQPRDTQMQLFSLELLRQVGARPDQIDAHVQRHTDAFDSDEPRYQLLRAAAYYHTDRPDQARDWIGRIDPTRFDDVSLGRAAVELTNGLGMPEQALEMLEAVADADRDPEAEMLLVRRLAEHERFEQIAQRLEQIDADSPQADTRLLAWRATALMQLDRQDEARPLIEELRARVDDDTAVRWARVLERVYDDNPQPARIIDAVERAGQMGEHNPFFQIWRARAQRSIGEIDLAVQAYQRAAQLSQHWTRPLVEAAHMLLEADQPEDAMSAAYAAFQRNPQSGQVVITLGAAVSANIPQFDAHDLEQAAELLTQIHENVPNEPTTLPGLVAVHLHQGDRDAAEAALDNALNDPDALPTSTLRQLVAAATTAGADDLADRVRPYLDERADQSPGLALERAFEHAAAGDIDTAIQRLEAGRDAAENDQQRLEWRFALAQLRQRIDDPAAAAEWRAIAEDHPDSLSVQRRLLDAQPLWNDRELMDTIIARVREITGESGLSWRIARARWLMQHESDERQQRDARELLEHVTQRAPERIQPRLLLARYFQQQDNTSAAITQLNRARQIEPQRVDVLMPLIELHERLGEQSEVNYYIDQLADAAGEMNPQQLTQVVQLMLRQAQPGAAVRLLERLENRDLQADVMLAQLYHSRGQIDDARAIYDARLDDDAPAPLLHHAANFYLAQGETDRADELLAQLERADAPEARKRLMLADHHRRRGESESVIEHLRAGTDADPESPELWRALVITHLQQDELADALDAAAHAHDALAAPDAFAFFVEHRDQLAEIEFHALLRPLLTAVFADPERGEIAAEVLTFWPRGEETDALDAAADQLAELAGQHRAFRELQVLAARVHYNLGEYDRAADIATQAAQRFSAASEPAWLAAEALTAAGRFSEGQAMAEQWRRRAQDRTELADAFLARTRIEQGDPAAALEQLEPYREQALASPDQYAPILTSLAHAYILEGQLDTARSMLESLLERDIRWRMLWLQLAGSVVPDHEHAVDWMRELARQWDSEADGETRSLALAHGWLSVGQRFSDDSALERSRDYLTDLIDQAEAPNAAWLQMLGTVYHAWDRPDDAEYHYRQAIELDSQLALAQNNLAMIALEHHDDPDQALPLARAAVRSEPFRASYRDTLGLVLGGLGRVDEAVEQLERAIQLERRNPEWPINLAYMLMNNDREQEAREVLTRIEEQFPDLDDLPDEARQRLRATRDWLAQHAGL